MTVTVTMAITATMKMVKIIKITITIVMILIKVNCRKKNLESTLCRNTARNFCPISWVQSQFYKQAIIMPGATTCKHFLAQTLFRACARENTNVYIYVFFLFLFPRQGHKTEINSYTVKRYLV